MSLLEEAKELIEMSLNTGNRPPEYTRKAKLWLEKTNQALQAHAAHHEDHEEAASCSLCGFDLACPSCGH